MLDRKVIFALRVSKTGQKVTIIRQVNHIDSIFRLCISIHTPLPVEFRVQRALFGVFGGAHFIKQVRQLFVHHASVKEGTFGIMIGKRETISGGEMRVHLAGHKVEDVK
jgi:hypothetical protein